MSAIDDLLRHPSLWRARTQQSASQETGLPTGHAALDRCLPGGGWPRQGLVEILTDRYGIGELSLLIPALAALCCEVASVPSERATGQGGWLAWVSPPYQPYAPALAASGIDVQRVLVVRAAPALWAMEQALRSGVCSAVLGWLHIRDPHELRRLQLAAEQNRCFTVLFRRKHEANTASPAVLRLVLSSVPGGLEARVLKSRGGLQQSVLLGRLTTPLHSPAH